jgi:hypothetical protein
VVVNPDILWSAVPENITPPDPEVKVPKLLKSPVRVMALAPGVKIAPTLMVSDTHVIGALSVTEFPPVVAMTTSSVATGTIPPTHVEPVFQPPPVVVLVMVAAVKKLVCKAKKRVLIATIVYQLFLRRSKFSIFKVFMKLLQL